jgi:hypothetical protein
MSDRRSSGDSKQPTAETSRRPPQSLCGAIDAPPLGNPQAFERGPNLLLALLVQDRLVFEPQHERVKPRN